MRGGGEAVTGFDLVVALPAWLAELAGGAAPPATVATLQRAQAHLLIYLQHADDALDDQRTIAPAVDPWALAA